MSFLLYHSVFLISIEILCLFVEVFLLESFCWIHALAWIELLLTVADNNLRVRLFVVFIILCTYLYFKSCIISNYVVLFSHHKTQRSEEESN